jgi:asparagine synthase (glutamine-hydrolysing)
MCGIVGFFQPENHDKKNTIAKMLSVISYRGPDEFGVFTDENCALGSARLSILALQDGSQPFYDEDINSCLVFNGEIFNHNELREQLISIGETLHTKAEGELLLKLYKHYGLEFVKLLNGQFAIAIWNRNTEELFLLRDRIGIRPLFFTVDNGNIHFASEIKSILGSQDRLYEFNPKSLAQINTFWTTVGGDTFLKGVFELEPAHYLRFHKGDFCVSRYWQWPFPSLQETFSEDPKELVKKFKKEFMKSVELRLSADVEVGSYLSGGIDSSAIVAAAKGLLHKNLRTYSVSFRDKSYDERDYQQLVVDKFQTEHHEICCENDDIANIFENVVWHTETPLFRTAPAPLNLLSKLVKKTKLKVILTGEGADEILLGYDLFRELAIRKFWLKNPNSTMRPQLFKKLYAYLPQFNNPRFANLAIQSFRPTLEENSDFYSHLIRWNNNSANQIYFSERLKQSLDGFNVYDSLKASLPAEYYQANDLDRAQYLEVYTLLKGYLLSSQGDRMAMSNSIEGRFPFLDHTFIEFCSKLPRKSLLNGLSEKLILKEAFRDQLPEKIVSRPKIAYQSPEIRAFLNAEKGTHELVSKYMSNELLESQGLFDKGKVEMLIKKAKNSNLSRLGTRDNQAYIQILSTSILFEKFVRRNEPYRIASKEFRNLNFSLHIKM